MANQQKRSVLIPVAAVFALVGLVIYLVTSFTGYLAASAVDPLPIVCSVVALAMLIAAYVAKTRLSALVADLLLLAAAALLIVSFVLFTLARVTLAADVYFIPVNYPASEGIALHISLVGIAGYLISILALTVDGFASKE